MAGVLISVIPWCATALVTAPTTEPLTVGDARKQCSLGDLTTFDDELVDLNIVARAKVEDLLARRIVTQTHDVYYQGFANPIVLPFGNLQAVTQMAYTDSAGATTSFTVTGNEIKTGGVTIATAETGGDQLWGTGRIVLNSQQSWPSVTLSESRPVRVRIRVGWEPENVPPALKRAMRLLVGHWFRNRESVNAQSYELPHGFEFLAKDWTVLA